MESEQTKSNNRLMRVDEYLDDAYDVWNAYLNVTYKMSIGGRENIPPDGPVLILPNHQSYLDIPIEGVTLLNGGKYMGPMGRYGYWVMKDSLPGWLDYLGAVRIGRGNDYKKKIGEEKKRLRLEINANRMDETKYKSELASSKIRIRSEIEELNREAFDYVNEIYNAGEILVAHLEGSRSNKGVLGNLKSTFVDITREISKECGFDIPVIPFGIEYGALRKINVLIGEPRSIYEDGLLEKIREDLKRLSNCCD